jgi:ActR/RegA family two-component response regulator
MEEKRGRGRPQGAMNRELKLEKYRDEILLRVGEDGESLSRVARELNVCYRTLKRFLERIGGIYPGGEV